MKKLNVFFVNLPSIPLQKLQDQKDRNRLIKVFPFGILYLSSFLKKQGCANVVRCIDYFATNFKQSKPIEEIISSVAVSTACGIEPDVLAISLTMTTSYEFFNLMLPILKKLWPTTTVVVGGHTATNAIEEVLKNKHVDYVIAGEGEEAFYSLITNLNKKEYLETLKGIHFSDKIDKTFSRTNPIQDLDSLPFPDWGLIDTEFYLDTDGSQLFWDGFNNQTEGKTKAATILTSRGCPFQCIFCAANNISGRKMRLRKTEKITEEVLELYKKYNINYLSIFDDLALPTEKRTKELLSAISKLEIPELRTSFSQAVNINATTTKMIDDIIKYTKPAVISFPVEATERKTQQTIKKKISLEKAQKLIRYSQNRGLIVTINIIFGFPNETLDEMKKTIETINNVLRPDWTQFAIALPVVGSNMYEQFSNLGFIKSSPEFWGQNLLNHRNFDTPWTTSEEINALREYANLYCNFIKNKCIVDGENEKAKKLYSRVSELYPAQIFALENLRQIAIKERNILEEEKLKTKIQELLNNNSESQHLYSTYGYLMPTLREVYDTIR